MLSLLLYIRLVVTRFRSLTTFAYKRQREDLVLLVSVGVVIGDRIVHHREAARCRWLNLRGLVGDFEHFYCGRLGILRRHGLNLDVQMPNWWTEV